MAQRLVALLRRQHVAQQVVLPVGRLRPAGVACRGMAGLQSKEERLAVMVWVWGWEGPKGEGWPKALRGGKFMLHGIKDKVGRGEKEKT